MINAKKLSGAAVAAAAAALFVTGCAGTGGDSYGATAAKVHCVGVNSCKGQSDCKSATNSCKGQNACKGQGFLALTKSECDAKGGKAT